MRKARRILIISLLLSLPACQQEIMHNVSESRANKAILSLSQVGVSAEKEKTTEGWSLRVQQADAPTALAHLQQARMLARSDDRAPMPEGGFILSREERTHFMERHLSSNLELTLERLPGVLEARVHLYLIPDNPLSWAPNKDKQSASALLIVGEEAPVSEESIRVIVAGASGMSHEQVSVIISRTPYLQDKPQATPAEEVVVASYASMFPTWGMPAAAAAMFLLFIPLCIRILRGPSTEKSVAETMAESPQLRPVVKPVKQSQDEEVF